MTAGVDPMISLKRGAKNQPLQVGKGRLRKRCQGANWLRFKADIFFGDGLHHSLQAPGLLVVLRVPAPRVNPAEGSAGQCAYLSGTTWRAPTARLRAPCQ